MTMSKTLIYLMKNIKYPIEFFYTQYSIIAQQTFKRYVIQDDYNCYSLQCVTNDFISE